LTAIETAIDGSALETDPLSLPRIAPSQGLLGESHLLARFAHCFLHLAYYPPDCSKLSPIDLPVLHDFLNRFAQYGAGPRLRRVAVLANHLPRANTSSAVISPSARIDSHRRTSSDDASSLILYPAAYRPNVLALSGRRQPAHAHDDAPFIRRAAPTQC